MSEGIKKVCVIGAGTMGAGIAAQVANAGVPVLLLDIAKDGDDRSAVARGAVEKMLKTEPAPFMSKAAAKLVEVGNIDDDLARVAECDWICEAIVERLDIKQSLYAKLEQLKRPDAAVSSNTSTIPLAKLVDGRSDAFKRHFLITHFFNPPRYMRLIEIVARPDSDAALVKRVSDFTDRALGKAVVDAKDSPGFIANRVGTYWMQVAVNAAMDMGLTVEEADAIGGSPMGVPKTGIFGLIDLVGIDLMPLLQGSLTSTLPATDAYQATVRPSPMIDKMIAEGFTGRKGKGGFYRFDRATKSKEALDLATGQYRPQQSAPRIAAKDVRALIQTPGKVGDYAWAILGPVLAYAAALVGEAADDLTAIDRAMVLGYNWKKGPFELIDVIGAADFAKRLEAAGIPVPAMVKLAGDRSFYRVVEGKRQYLGSDGDYHDVPRPEGVILLEDLKRASKPIMKNGSAALWDIGDGVAAFEITSKMGALDGDVMALLGKAIGHVATSMKALVVTSDQANFSVGANLGLAIFAANIAAWGEIEKSITGGQMALKALKYAPFPVVAAPAGMTLGGGCEIVMHADAIQAHAESYIGLVECGVGLIPGWGGCGELLDRLAKGGTLHRGPMPAVAKAFETISTAQVSKSAANAREMGFLRKDDRITMNRDRLLADAKARALALVEGYQPPAPPEFRLPGETAQVGLAGAVAGFVAQGKATAYDQVVAGTLAEVLSGGDTDIMDVVTEQEMLGAERKGFLERLRDPRTMARVEHMLETGKPLRN